MVLTVVEERSLSRRKSLTDYKGRNLRDHIFNASMKQRQHRKVGQAPTQHGCASLTSPTALLTRN